MSEEEIESLAGSIAEDEQQAEDYRQAFLGSLGDETIQDQLDDWDKLSMAEASLWLNIGRPKTKAAGTTAERLRLYEFEDWLPWSADEAFAATHAGYARKSYRAISEIYDRAHNRKEVFKAGTRDGEPNIQLIRHNRPLLYAIGDYLMAREAFINGQWASKKSDEYTRKQLYWRGLVLTAAELADKLITLNRKNDPLLQLYGQIKPETVKADEYWHGELGLVARSAGSTAVKNEAEISNTATDEVEESDKKIPNDWGPVSEEDRRYLENKRKEFEEMWDHLDQAGMPEGVKLDRLYAAFPMFEPAERAYAREIKEGQEARARALAEQGSNGKKKRARRRGIGLPGLNEDEPPPDIPDARRFRG